MEDDREQPWNFHTCKFCPYRSKKTFLMCKHVRRHRRTPNANTFICDSKTPEMFECEVCEFSTSLKVNLRKHYRLFHEKKDVSNQIVEIFKCYRCKSCAFCTHSVIVLAKHVNDCNKLFLNKFKKRCEQTKKEKKSAGTESAPSRPPNSFICDLKTPEKIECDLCAFKTDLQVVLIEHLNVLHKKLKVNSEIENILDCYCCQSCNFDTYSVIVLAKHVNDHNHVFLRKSKTKCDPTEKENKSAKLELSKTARKYECQYCSYKALHNGHFKRHVLAKHKTRGRPKRKKNKSTKKSDTPRPPKTVKKHECQHCSYTTSQKSHFKRHVLLRHTEAKDDDIRFDCSQCGFKFKQKRYLESHILTKHGKPEDVRWFKCTRCDFATIYKRSLPRHIRVVHKTKNYKVVQL